MTKKKVPVSGIVYSTDPTFKVSGDQQEEEYLLPADQKLTVRLETKHRAGKAVTLVEGFVGSTIEKETIGKKIKSFCGTGGSVKEGEILIQGDQREKVLQWLTKNGFKNIRKI